MTGTDTANADVCVIYRDLSEKGGWLARLFVAKRDGTRETSDMLVEMDSRWDSISPPTKPIPVHPKVVFQGQSFVKWLNNENSSEKLAFIISSMQGFPEELRDKLTQAGVKIVTRLSRACNNDNLRADDERLAISRLIIALSDLERKTALWRNEGRLDDLVKDWCPLVRDWRPDELLLRLLRDYEQQLISELGRANSSVEALRKKVEEKNANLKPSEIRIAALRTAIANFKK